MISGRACAKAILIGEHAVLYGCPALAVPLPQLEACVTLTAHSHTLRLEAPDLGLNWELPEPPETPAHPLQKALKRALASLKLGWPALRIRVQSQIPVACGLGSGTAVSTALWRALTHWSGQQATLPETLAFVQSMDQDYHGRASGLDAEVIVRACPLRFDSSRGMRPLSLGQPLTLVVADSGQSAPTHLQVAAVAAWQQADPQAAASVLDTCRQLSAQAETALESGDLPRLGQLLNQAQFALQRMGVSTPQLERLCAAARQAGALGAKLSGAGGGGVMLALSTAAQAPTVARALQQAGARQSHVISIAQETYHV